MKLLSIVKIIIICILLQSCAAAGLLEVEALEVTSARAVAAGLETEAATFSAVSRASITAAEFSELSGVLTIEERAILTSGSIASESALTNLLGRIRSNRMLRTSAGKAKMYIYTDIDKTFEIGEMIDNNTVKLFKSGKVYRFPGDAYVVNTTAILREDPSLNSNAMTQMISSQVVIILEPISNESQFVKIRYGSDIGYVLVSQLDPINSKPLLKTGPSNSKPITTLSPNLAIQSGVDKYNTMQANTLDSSLKSLAYDINSKFNSKSFRTIVMGPITNSLAENSQLGSFLKNEIYTNLLSASNASQLQYTTSNSNTKYEDEHTLAIELGKQYKADALIIGVVTKLDGQYLLRTTLLDCKSGYAFGSAKTNFPSSKAVDDMFAQQSRLSDKSNIPFPYSSSQMNTSEQVVSQPKPEVQTGDICIMPYMYGTNVHIKFYDANNRVVKSIELAYNTTTKQCVYNLPVGVYTLVVQKYSPAGATIPTTYEPTRTEIRILPGPNSTINLQ